jgi:hypothetical protein
VGARVRGFVLSIDLCKAGRQAHIIIIIVIGVDQDPAIRSEQQNFPAIRGGARACSRGTAPQQQPQPHQQEERGSSQASVDANSLAMYLSQAAKQESPGRLEQTTLYATEEIWDDTAHASCISLELA